MDTPSELEPGNQRHYHLLKARYHNPDIVSNSASENYCLRVVGKEVPDIRLKISFQFVKIAKKAY